MDKSNKKDNENLARQLEEEKNDKQFQLEQLLAGEVGNVLVLDDYDDVDGKKFYEVLRLYSDLLEVSN